MRKGKKVLSAVLVPCMVGSLLAGCSTSSTDATLASDEKGTSGSAAEPTSEDAGSESAESSTEPSSEETTEAPETPVGGSAAQLMELLNGMSGVRAYSYNTSVNLDVDGQEVDFDVEALADLDSGNMQVSIGGKIEAEEFAYDGDLMTLSLVDGMLYLDMGGLYDGVMEALGEDGRDAVETYANAFELTMEDVEKLMALGIPVGDLNLSDLQTEKLQNVMKAVYTDLGEALDGLEEPCVEGEDGVYSVKLDKTNVVSVMEAVMTAFDGKIEDVFDAFVDYMENYDVTAVMGDMLNSIMDEVITGVEGAVGQEVTDEQREQIKDSVKESMEELELSWTEAIDTLKESKEEAVKTFAEVLEEFAQEKDSMQEELDSSEADFSLNMKVDGDATEGSRSLNTELKCAVKVPQELADEMTEGEITISEISLSMKSSIQEESAVSIKAPEKYTSLSELVQVAYNIYMLIEQDPSTGPDQEYETLSQEEIAQLYGVALKDNQYIMAYDYNELTPAVVATAMDGFEFYGSEGNSFIMEYDDNFNYITIYVNSEQMGKDFYEEYYAEDGLEKIADDLYCYDAYGSLTGVYFTDDISLEISFDEGSDEEYEKFIGDDKEAFFRSVIDTIEIVPAP